MYSIDFQEANITYGKPADMTDEQCHAVRAQKGIDGEGLPFVTTVWMPSYEDLQALNAGRPIVLKLIAHSMVPVCLYTYDENLQPNV